MYMYKYIKRVLENYLACSDREKKIHEEKLELLLALSSICSTNKEEKTE